MPMRPFRLTQKLAIAALISYAGFFVVSQRFYADSDAKLATILTWAHYGSVLSRLPLWYASIVVVSILVMGLVAVAFNRRWGAWVVLAATCGAFALIPFSGVAIFAATARLFGGIAMACVLSILSLTFLVREDRARL
jgi:hypothetical protein